MPEVHGIDERDERDAPDERDGPVRPTEEVEVLPAPEVAEAIEVHRERPIDAPAADVIDQELEVELDDDRR